MLGTSNKNWDSVTTKGGDGSESITTRLCASPPMVSRSPSGRLSPSPQETLQPGSSRSLPFPKVGADGAPPARPERHVPNSITTLRLRLALALAAFMPRCPCCQRAMPALEYDQDAFVTQ